MTTTESKDMWHNPDAPPGCFPPELDFSTPRLIRNPDAPPGMYKFQSENNMKVYLPEFDFVIDCSIVLDAIKNGEDLSVFVRNPSSEESDSCEDGEIRVVDEIVRKKKEDETNDKGVKRKKDKLVSSSKPSASYSSSSKPSTSHSSSLKPSTSKHPKQIITYSDSSSDSIPEEPRKKVVKNHRSHIHSTSGRSSSHSRIRKSHSSSRKKSHSKKSSRRSSSSNSRSSSPISFRSEDKYEMPVKTDSINEPDFLFGSYYCEVCNIKLTSETIYMSHKNGKKHLKALKAKDPQLAVSKIKPLTATDSKYPAAPAGIDRVRSRELAQIQVYLEENLKTPCPGLENVTEIQGMSETSYYCELCDAACSSNCIFSHLSGYPHRLNCFKFFDNDRYDDIKHLPKYRVQQELHAALKAIEKEKGLGCMSVEKEVLSSKIDSVPEPRRDLQKPSTSAEEFTNDDSRAEFNKPDPTRPGFYCKLCASPMNSLAVFENHIRGKRHLANLKKIPGAVPSKVKYIEDPNRPSILLEKLKSVEVPIVGLNQIREAHNLEANCEQYQCFMCGGCYTSLDIIDHLVSQKHKRNYLYSIKHPEYLNFESCNVSDFTNTVVDEISQRVEMEYGRCRPLVVVDKNSIRK